VDPGGHLPKDRLSPASSRAHVASAQRYHWGRVIIGDIRTFAIESEITEAYERPCIRALGLFVTHVGGARYGVYDATASLLANSFDAVQSRIARRGLHTAPFAEKRDPGKSPTLSAVLFMLTNRRMIISGSGGISSSTFFIRGYSVGAGWGRSV
jgi:Immunity protein 42